MQGDRTNSRWFKVVLIIGCGGLAGCLYVFHSRQWQRIHSEQKVLAQRLIVAQDQERQRIAAGLHDSLGQNLILIKNRCLLALDNKALPEGAIEQLNEISKTTSQALEEVREIAHNLRPYQIDRLGLTKALWSMVNKISRASPIQFHTELANIDGLLPSEAEINLYRILQEGLNNILKHSGASQARVILRHTRTGMMLLIEDNGHGFDFESTVHNHQIQCGFGLQDIAERAHILRGSLRWETAPGHGARFCIDIPCVQTSH